MMKVFTSVLTVTMMVCGATLAQQETAPEPRSAAGQEPLQQSQDSERMLTNFYSAKLMLMSYCTIQMSEMAQEKSSTTEVKQFASKLVEEHRQLNEALCRCAPEMEEMILGERDSLAAKSSPKDTVSTKRPARESAATGGSESRGQQQTAVATSAGHNLPWQKILTIERQAADNYLQASTTMLQKHEGQDFDMGFLGFQIGAHTRALAKLKALDSTGDKQFQKIVSDATQKTEQHLQEAQRLAMKFEDDRRRASE